MEERNELPRKVDNHVKKELELIAMICKPSRFLQYYETSVDVSTAEAYL